MCKNRKWEGGQVGGKKGVGGGGCNKRANDVTMTSSVISNTIIYPNVHRGPSEVRHQCK